MNNNTPTQPKKPPKPGEAGEYIPHVNKGIAITAIVAFMALLLIPTLVWGVLQIANYTNPQIMVALNPDTKENRDMARFPDKFDPEKITVEIENWFNDNLPFRSILYNAYISTKNEIEVPYEASIRTELMKIFPTASQLKPVIPDNGGEDWTSNETDPVEEETLPEFTETLPPYIDPVIPDGTDNGGGGEATEPEENPDGNPGDNRPAVCEHEKGEGVIETAPTCTEYGVRIFYCTKCNAYMGGEYIQKIKHNYKNVDTTSNRICGHYYDETYECTACHHTYTESNVLKKHTKGTKIKTVDPSEESYGYTLVACADCGGEYRMGIKNRLSPTGIFMPYIRGAEKIVLEGRYRWLFYYYGDNSDAYYEGTNLMSSVELAAYVATMNELQALCEERGIQLQLCIWPNKEQVYSEFTGKTPQTQTKRVDLLVEYVKKNSDINLIYPLSELKDAKRYFETYFQYDTHWNNAGGFVGYQAMLKALGLETCDPVNVEMYRFEGGASSSDYKKDPYCGSLGDMLGKAGVSYSGSFNYAIKYRQDVKITLHEGGNGASDTRHTVASNAPNDLNFVMLADSYRVMQLSYLEKDFTDCFLTHRNRVNDADVKAAILNADILVIAAVERYETDILNTAKTIINILKTAK